ncbi:doublecortin domain-containing protein 2C [Tupaia chinensis]|uniref:doublecortin domain-containing protein 2C n=1 Tax=Tupaia chinensis TaxID=246437 RepID=UPI00070463D6|nr:doublecortin domain-containing protein 2C [Tupaia chinensis]
MRKLKEIKPVVHCDLNVPSRWQAYHRVSRHVNVFTNGRLFIPPVKIIIPKFCLSDWTHVLAVIGEKVFPLGGVRKLFTMTGHLLDSSEDLQDNHFYVAAGLETFKPVPYWKSPRVPSEVQLKFAADAEKHPQRKKKEDSKAKEPHLQDGLPPKTQDSVYYAKEGARPELAGPVVRSGAEGDVYTAPTPNKEARGAPEVKEDPCMQVEVPVDQAPAEMVGENEEICDDTSSLGGTEVKEEGRLYDDPERKEDYSRMCFKKKFPLRHNTKKKASLKSLSKNKKVVPVPEKVPHDVLEEKNTPVLPAENEAQTEPPRRQQSHELSPRQGQLSEEQASSEQSSQEQSSQEQLSEEQASQEQASQEQLSEEQEPPDQSSPRQPSQEQLSEEQEPPDQSSLRQPSQEQLPEEQEPPEQSPLGQPSQEHIPEKPKSPEQASLEQASQNK